MERRCVVFDGEAWAKPRVCGSPRHGPIRSTFPWARKNWKQPPTRNPPAGNGIPDGDGRCAVTFGLRSARAKRRLHRGRQDSDGHRAANRSHLRTAGDHDALERSHPNGAPTGMEVGDALALVIVVRSIQSSCHWRPDATPAPIRCRTGPRRCQAETEPVPKRYRGRQRTDLQWHPPREHAGLLLRVAPSGRTARAGWVAARELRDMHAQMLMIDAQWEPLAWDAVGRELPKTAATTEDVRLAAWQEVPGLLHRPGTARTESVSIPGQRDAACKLTVAASPTEDHWRARPPGHVAMPA